MFSLEDLKFGDVVTLRNGLTGLVAIERIEYNDSSFNNIQDFNNNLTCKTGFKQIDIVKVQRYDEIMSGHYELQTLYERKEEILTAKEKEYLAAVIKPFRDRVTYISKRAYTRENTRYHILIHLKDDYIDLPYFEDDTMYKGMEISQEYTLEELGL